ncbi:hypothetical protein OE88DRAFT_1645261 [Heliocybe sulcata]|uniref:Uncharacterized protein n=1 Tax=Heliocybe sulcata TaxID=5364 RepID=A0A5C3N1V2_9AGAM|nr:hypothetical protein OE88DRAFT_1645261 [Heliocybe sulcata]
MDEADNTTPDAGFYDTPSTGSESRTSVPVISAIVLPEDNTSVLADFIFRGIEAKARLKNLNTCLWQPPRFGRTNHSEKWRSGPRSRANDELHPTRGMRYHSLCWSTLHWTIILTCGVSERAHGSLTINPNLSTTQNGRSDQLQLTPTPSALQKVDEQEGMGGAMERWRAAARASNGEAAPAEGQMVSSSAIHQTTTHPMQNAHNHTIGLVGQANMGPPPGYDIYFEHLPAYGEVELARPLNASLNPSSALTYSGVESSADMGNYPIKWSRKPYGRELSILHVTPVPKYTRNVGNAEDGGGVREMTACPEESNGPATEHTEASSINKAAAPSTRTTEPADKAHSNMMTDLSIIRGGRQEDHPHKAEALHQAVQNQTIITTHAGQNSAPEPVWVYDEEYMEEDKTSEADNTSEYMYESDIDSEGSDAWGSLGPQQSAKYGVQSLPDTLCPKKWPLSLHLLLYSRIYTFNRN